MRRIVHYYPGAMGNSGVTYALWSWAEAQAAAGSDVQVLYSPESYPTSDVAFVSTDNRARIAARSIPHRGRHRLTLRPVGLDRYLGSNDLLVLHEGWVPSNMVAAAAARRARVPYVVMPHGVYERVWTEYLKGPRRVRDFCERQVLERAAAVHMFFDSEIDNVRSIAPGATPLIVPTGYTMPGERWTGGGGYLAWIGRIDPVNKGLDALVGAVARLPAASRPTVRIRGYDYKGGIARLQQLITERDVAGWVSIDRAIAGVEKTRFLQQADGYVHPSRWECHSIALLENLALGVPCIASKTMHIAETLRRSSAAVLAHPREEELADALTRLPGRRADLTGRARALVTESFNWTTLIPRYQAALGQLGLN